MTTMLPEATKLCPNCSQLVFGASASPTLQIWPDIKALAESSTRCACCRYFHTQCEYLVQKALLRFPGLRESKLRRRRIDLAVKSDDTLLPDLRIVDVGVRIRLKNNFDTKAVVSVLSCPKDSKSAALPAWQSFPTSLEDKLDHIRRCLNVCERDHPACQPVDRSFVPTRLIELDLAAEGVVARLVTVADLGVTDLRYTALSYCWGDTQPVRLLKANHEGMKICISWSELPLTMRDAMSYTKDLGIGYIWIDSLCIVQDDPEDWAFEAERMLRVYAGSHLSFLAREAANANGGCFSCGDSLADPSLPLRALLASDGTDDGDAVYAHLRVQPTKVRGPLRSRGWTLQEAILSRRTVEVKQSELGFRCHSEVHLETGLKMRPEIMLRTAAQQVPVLGETVDVDTQVDPKWNHIWWKHMEDYTRRRFTYSRDRFPALAGLAELYRRITGDEPFLGLWKSTLHEDLSWMRSDSQCDRELDPPLSSPLPSWSPFSCRQSVEFRPWHSRRWGQENDKREYDSYEDVESCLTILNSQASWTGRPFVSDPGFSALLIRGAVQVLHLAQALEAEEQYVSYFNVNEECLSSRRRRHPWRCTVQWDEERYRPPAAWTCLLVERKTPVKYKIGAETFLVLEHVPSAASNSVYRRIGLGSLGKRRDRSEDEAYEWTFDLANELTLVLI